MTGRLLLILLFLCAWAPQSFSSGGDRVTMPQERVIDQGDGDDGPPPDFDLDENDFADPRSDRSGRRQLELWLGVGFLVGAAVLALWRRQGPRT